MYSTRIQAANLLHFCFSRVRLLPNRSSADAELLAQLPQLLFLSRAIAQPLLERGGPAGNNPASNEAVLLRGIIGTQSY